MSSPLGGNPNMIPLSECEICLRIWILKKRNTFSNFLLLEVAYPSGSLCSFYKLSLQHVLLPFSLTICSQLSFGTFLQKRHSLPGIAPKQSLINIENMAIFGTNMLKTQKLQGDLFGQQKPTSQLPQLPGPRFAPWKCGFSVPWNPPPLRRHPHPRWLRPCSLNIPMKNAGTGTFPFEMVRF